MSEQKQIKINMDDFNFNTTRKKKKTKDVVPTNKIKIKSPANKPKADTLKKRSLLRLIRQQQEDRYNKLFGTNSTSNISSKTEDTKEMVELKTEIDKAKDYLNNLKDKHDKTMNNHNSTIKQRPVIQPTYSHNSQNASNLRPQQTIPTLPITSNQPVVNTLPPSIQSQKPMYGCLKNGNLPTYRNFIHTSKNQPAITIGESVVNNLTQLPSKNPTIVQPREESKSINETKLENNINNGLKRMTEWKQTNEITNKKKYRPKRQLQRRTIRRTYKIGRSSKLPKVSVLISNKTIRNNTTTKSQLLKQTSIQDVKRHLIKRGLIRVGSSTPNDVLRKMYESSMLMCGEVQNHNPDNLLYNYMNGEEDL